MKRGTAVLALLLMRAFGGQENVPIYIHLFLYLEWTLPHRTAHHKEVCGPSTALPGRKFPLFPFFPVTMLEPGRPKQESVNEIKALVFPWETFAHFLWTREPTLLPRAAQVALHLSFLLRI